MARHRLDLPDRPAACPRHPGSRIWADRPTRRWSPFHESRAYRCVPADGSPRHLLTPALVRRELSPANPKAGLPCPHCGSLGLDAHGPTCVTGFTFSVAEAAQALVNAGKGESYCEISADLRRVALRPRQPGRPTAEVRRLAPRRPAPPRTPRPLVDPKAYGRRLPKGDTKRKAYNYSREKEVKSLYVQPSRTGNLAQSYVDVFAPVILDAFPVAAWPEIVIFDSLPIKRRRIAKNSKGRIARVSNGETQGEIFVAADGTTTPGTPILAGLEGSKALTSVARFLRRLPTSKEPVWVVSDLDEGIRAAIAEVWPNAVRYRCEEHLHMGIRKALLADGIDPWVERGDPNAAPEDAKHVKVSGSFIEHRLYYLMRACLWSEKRWTAFADAVDAVVHEDRDATRKWIRENTRIVLEQVELRERFPGYPRSTGAVEGTIRRLKSVVGGRAEYFRNAARLEKLVNLVRLDAIGAADADTYASLITRHLLARDGAGLDWQSGRDVYGTSSIDERIQKALDEQAAASAKREEEQRKARLAARTEKVNAWLTEQGLPAIGRAVESAALDPIYALPREGRTLADYPELVRQYEPTRNGGVPAELRTAASAKRVEWVCTAHRRPDGSGHDHVWPAPVEQRTRGSRCPYCTGKKACPDNCLAKRRSDLAREWHQPKNGSLTPYDVTPGSNREVFWKCEEDPTHEPYPQRIVSRVQVHYGCPGCVDAALSARARSTANAYTAEKRRRAREQRPVTVPPVLDHGERDRPLEGLLISIRDVAAALGRSEQTMRNWIRGGRMRARIPASRWVGYQTSQDEVDRLRQILGVPDDDRAA